MGPDRGTGCGWRSRAQPSLDQSLSLLLPKERNDPMQQTSGTWQNRAFVSVFFVLTLLCWCPLGYGSYGPAGRFLGIPSWAAVALAVGGVLFVVEWVYLFRTQLAVNDEQLPDIISQLKAVDAGHPVPAKEDE